MTVCILKILTWEAYMKRRVENYVLRYRNNKSVDRNNGFDKEMKFILNEKFLNV